MGNDLKVWNILIKGACSHMEKWNSNRVYKKWKNEIRIEFIKNGRMKLNKICELFKLEKLSLAI